MEKFLNNIPCIQYAGQKTPTKLNVLVTTLILKGNYYMQGFTLRLHVYFTWETREEGKKPDYS